MAATFYEPAIPLGFDSGIDFAFDDSLNDSLFLSLDMQILSSWNVESPDERTSSHGASDAAAAAAKSPCRSNLPGHGTPNASSRSPGSGILTPASTLLEFGDAAAINDLRDDANYTSISPTSSIGAFADEYIYGPNMTERPPPSSGSGVSPSTQPSPASSTAPFPAASLPPWLPSSSTTAASAPPMDPGHSDQFGNHHFPSDYSFDNDAIATTENLNSALLSDFESFHDATAPAINAELPFRTAEESWFDPVPLVPYSPFVTLPPQLQGMTMQSGFTSQQRPPPDSSIHRGLALPTTTSALSPTSIPQPLVAPSGPRFAQRDERPARTHSATNPPVASQLLSPHSAATPRHRTHSSSPRQAIIATASSSRPLQPAAAGSTRAENIASSSHSDRIARRGGRERHSHLPEGTRTKSHKMRKAVACWKCALQRDPCPDEATPCKRCITKSQKGQTFFFECDRSKLPDFVFDFLPASMTLMHQKQTIEDFVSDQVQTWDTQHFIDVDLTCGYGPPLRWRLYEFVPRTPELLGQMQYLQHISTGTAVRFHKWSPPLGLLKLDTSDNTHFESYIERLLQEDYLWEFGWTCFEEETLVDDFQARLLTLLCQLYSSTADVALKDLVKNVLRMMIITYIMGHTLTIPEDTLPRVLGAMRHAATPRPAAAAPHTSPRLANQQLKFFFSLLRNASYERLLHWQQQTLHSSGRREATWLPAFCVTLGFAMMLEEVQRLLHLQADTKAHKGQATAEQAATEAANACARIDTRFRLLVGLFQCKYRDRRWGRGCFGPGTPDLPDPASRLFLHRLHLLLVEKRAHLESRQDVAPAPENQCRYTSRLVARFLLPFAGLPP